MVERFLRCEYCGGTYSVEREWCPHCLAPRPEREVTETRASIGEANVFYVDDVPYHTIDSESEPKSFAELEARMKGLNDELDRIIEEHRGIVTPNETRELLDQCSDVGDDCIRWCELGMTETDEYDQSQARIDEIVAQIDEIKRKTMMMTIVAASSVLVLAIAYCILTMLFPMSRQ